MQPQYLYGSKKVVNHYGDAQETAADRETYSWVKGGAAEEGARPGRSVSYVAPRTARPPAPISSGGYLSPTVAGGEYEEATAPEVPADSEYAEATAPEVRGGSHDTQPRDEGPVYSTAHYDTIEYSAGDPGYASVLEPGTVSYADAGGTYKSPLEPGTVTYADAGGDDSSVVYAATPAAGVPGYGDAAGYSRNPDDLVYARPSRMPVGRDNRAAVLKEPDRRSSTGSTGGTGKLALIRTLRQRGVDYSDCTTVDELAALVAATAVSNPDRRPSSNTQSPGGMVVRPQYLYGAKKAGADGTVAGDDDQGLPGAADNFAELYGDDESNVTTVPIPDTEVGELCHKCGESTTGTQTGASCIRSPFTSLTLAPFG